MTPRWAIGMVAVVLAACQIVQVETPDPAAVPSGSLVARGAQATGPIVEVGSGQAAGIGWRYVVYPSDDGLCTQLETAELASAGCGAQLPAEGSAFGTVGQGGSEGLRVVDGIVAGDIATVWVIEADTGRRFPATLMPLDEADLEGQAFVGFVPDEMDPTHLQALRMSGEIVETFELTPDP